MKRLALTWGANVAAFAIATGVAAPAQAEAIVIGSNISGVSIGMVLDDAKVVDVGAGQTLRLMLPSGRTKVVKGPAKAAVLDLTRNQTRNEKVWAKVLASLSGKSGSDSSRIGAVRGMAAAPVPNAVPAVFSLTTVPTKSTGTVCVRSDFATQLQRSGSGKAASVTVFHMGSGKKAKASFKADAVVADWPEGLPRENGVYAILADGQPMRQLMLHILNPAPADDAVLPALVAADCDGQVMLYLEKRG